MTGRERTILICNWVAGTIAVIASVLVPLAYFVISYTYTAGTLQTEAEINSRLVSGIVNENPEMWRFEQMRLEEVLARRPRGRHREVRRITDLANRVIAESADPISPPVLTRFRPLMDSGVPVGTISVSRSLRPLLSRTALVACAGLGVGVLVFVLLRIMPFRAIIRAEEEISALNASLEVYAREVEATNRELETFSYTISHDLRVPLTNITCACDALSANSQGERNRKLIGYIHSENERMRKMIEAILRFSRSLHKGMEREKVDLTAMARSIATDLRIEELRRRGEFRVAEGLTADGDPELLKVIMSNLLENAWKYTGQKEAPLIEVGMTEFVGETAFFVRDNGAGFDQAKSDLLFRTFQRLHEQDDFPGTGIGLATVRRIVERHGGRVWAEGETGKGATFYFTLPTSGQNNG